MSNLQVQDLLIMLIEPSSTQRHIIRNQMEEIGAEHVISAKDGETALQEMRRNTPDLVVSSLYLPDMTGTDLVHRIREDEKLHDMAFMLISSETRFRYLDPIRQAGAVAILPKPFTTKDLRIAMRSTLDYVDPSEMELDDFVPEELEVLVVDDSPLARKHITRVLSSLGIEKITLANDGEEAVDVINGKYFDLVVTDYNMPNMDGQELTDYIRKHSNQSSIPILMVTSEENESRLAAVQQSGVSAICDKPFETGSVKSLVQQILSIS